MNRKIMSAISLGVSVAAFLAMLALAFDAVLAIMNLDINDLSGDISLPGETVVGLTVAMASILGGLAFWEFVVAVVGFFASLININISQSRGVKIISYVFFGFYSIIIILIALCALLLFKEFL